MAWAEIITTTKKLKCYRHVYENKQFGKCTFLKNNVLIDFTDSTFEIIRSFSSSDWCQHMSGKRHNKKHTNYVH